MIFCNLTRVLRNSNSFCRFIIALRTNLSRQETSYFLQNLHQIRFDIKINWWQMDNQHNLGDTIYHTDHNQLFIMSLSCITAGSKYLADIAWAVFSLSYLFYSSRFTVRTKTFIIQMWRCFQQEDAFHCFLKRQQKKTHQHKKI